ncbi:hypothetical protein QM588_04360 [Rhodococcus sp. IEGM 1354]|uniref:hypothetical protein n=1 Tax=Rhodococcus sp. IEGM 1354 TaxID=3047088 RepID=UPI0024B7D400|nr:hypothetical protein [Rhodococcus sp. IEGM 1354]MDI9929631.1 hypothetical protein [Rhodococcus sp. IEGM 1354]
MTDLWLGFLAFGALFAALVVSSVLREREVPSDGAIGRGSGRINRAVVLSATLIVLLLLAAVVVIVRFQQIAIWE